MSDKKTAEEIAKTIPCQCSDCGMRESEATQMIQAYADQELASLRDQVDTWKGEYVTARRQAEEFRKELASLREQLVSEKESTKTFLDRSTELEYKCIEYRKQLKQKEDENRELVEHLSMILTMDKFEEYFSREFLDKTESLISRLSAK